jgi:hypothetical protein
MKPAYNLRIIDKGTTMVVPWLQNREQNHQ